MRFSRIALPLLLAERRRLSLALLGLARALSAAGDSAGARETHDRLLTNWADSDPTYRRSRKREREPAGSEGRMAADGRRGNVAAAY